MGERGRVSHGEKETPDTRSLLSKGVGSGLECSLTSVSSFSSFSEVSSCTMSLAEKPPSVSSACRMMTPTWLCRPWWCTSEKAQTSWDSWLGVKARMVRRAWFAISRNN